NVYNAQSNYPKALDCFFKALKIAEELDFKIGILHTLGNIGNVYGLQQDYKNALEFSLSGLKVAEAIGSEEGMAISYTRTGIIYQLQKKYDESLEIHLKGLRIYEKLGDKGGISTALINIGVLYEVQDKKSKALDYYFKALKITEEIGDKSGTSNLFSNIGNIYLNDNEIEHAEKYLHNALDLSTEIGSLQLIKSHNEKLSDLYSKKRDWETAFVYYRKSVEARDSLKNEETAKQQTQLEMNYMFEKKDALAKAEQDKKDVISFKELQWQKLVRNGFVGGFVVVLLFAIIFFTQRNHIQKGKQRSDELLLNILPSEVAEELKTTGTTMAKDFQEVTVLFTDFKNFTQLSEQLSAKELVNEINFCYSAFDNIMTKHGIEKIKTIGDSYMCAGGLPVANKMNAVDTVTAAIEIRDFMLAEKHERDAKGKPFFEIRIGCNTGPVVAGIVGIKKF
ncbi:MAG: tetratricopeptide repeat protein, partial [Bacteroidota bacterium]|nr:tetratricopeptide repeat protein [Bacteroidota bacterium]